MTTFLLVVIILQQWGHSTILKDLKESIRVLKMRVYQVQEAQKKERI